MAGRDDATFVLDSGAIIGVARGNRRLRSRFDAIRSRGYAIRVPMVVVAETTRGNGPRDAAVNIVLAQCGPQQPLDESVARHAGRLLGLARSSSTIDALVVAEASTVAPSVILTSDPDDLMALAAALPGVLIERV